MAATAQDPSAPLRGPEKKDEDRDEDSEYLEDQPLKCLHVLLNLIVLQLRLYICT